MYVKIGGSSLDQTFLSAIRIDLAKSNSSVVYMEFCPLQRPKHNTCKSKGARIARQGLHLGSQTQVNNIKGGGNGPRRNQRSDSQVLDDS